MSTKTREAKEWLEGALDGMNERARGFNEETALLRVSLDELTHNSQRALQQAIAVAAGFGMPDVAQSLQALVGMLPPGPFMDDPVHEADEPDIIDAEFEVLDES